MMLKREKELIDNRNIYKIFTAITHGSEGERSFKVVKNDMMRARRDQETTNDVVDDD